MTLTVVSCLHRHASLDSMREVETVQPLASQPMASAGFSMLRDTTGNAER
jgi:hypothetical protein